VTEAPHTPATNLPPALADYADRLLLGTGLDAFDALRIARAELERYLESDERVERPRMHWPINLDFLDFAPPPGARSVLELRDVTFSYPGSEPLLDHVSFEVRYGQRVALVGPNGSGKSTLLRILAGEETPDSGEVTVAGLDVFCRPVEVRRKIGYMPYNCPLYPEMRVAEYLHFRAGIKGLHGPRREERIDYVLRRCWLTDVRRQLIGTLSKGYRQRVGLADAMINDPPLLILDEPTDGLDPGQKAETLGMLRDLGRDHTIMLSSHMLSEVERLVNRVIILRRGYLGMAKKMSELETNDVIVVEVRGPVDQVTNVLRTTEGVASVTSEGLGDGLTQYQVRTHRQQDLREIICQRVVKSGWVLRRLDLRRQSLQDRRNEINNFDDFDSREPRSATPRSSSMRQAKRMRRASSSARSRRSTAAVIGLNAYRDSTNSKVRKMSKVQIISPPRSVSTCGAGPCAASAACSVRYPMMCISSIGGSGPAPARPGAREPPVSPG